MTISFSKGDPDAVNRRVTVPVATWPMSNGKPWRVRQAIGTSGWSAKVAPDSGEVLHDGYVQLPQLVRGSDTRQREDVRRSYGAGTEDYLPAIDGELSRPLATRTPTARLPSKTTPSTRQLGLMVRPSRLRARVEVAYRRAHSHAAGDVEGQRPTPVELGWLWSGQSGNPASRHAR